MGQNNKPFAIALLLLPDSHVSLAGDRSRQQHHAAFLLAMTPGHEPAYIVHMISAEADNSPVGWMPAGGLRRRCAPSGA